MFTGKYLCLSLFFINIQAWKPATLLKKRLRHRCFPVKFARFLRTPFFTEHLQWLLQEISHEFSLYCIWEQWMVSFRGTYLLSSAYFILLGVSRFFLFLSFFYFLWILLLFRFKENLPIFKIMHWSCSYVPKWSLQEWITSAFFSN